MTGHVRRRGERSWEIKFDLGTDPSTGKRLTRYHSFKGTKREADAELVRLKAGADRGDYVDPSQVTVQEMSAKWLAKPRGDKPLATKTRESYASLLSAHVYPSIGSQRLQRVTGDAMKAMYATMAISGNRSRRKGGEASGLSVRTIRYVHALLKNIFGYAVELKLISTTPMAYVKPPAREKKMVEFLDAPQMRDVLRRLQGQSIYMLASLALGTGLRRSEMLALRWSDIDLDGGLLSVSRSIEQTKGCIAFKKPKTDAGVRVVSLPSAVANDLRTHRTAQAERLLALGIKTDTETLVFGKLDGTPQNPNSVSTEWRRVVRVLKLPKVRFHALRHSHATLLLNSGMPILGVAKQLGHADATVTLTVYAHTEKAPDFRPAELLNSAFAGATEAEQKRSLQNSGGGNPVATITPLRPRRGTSI